MKGFMHEAYTLLDEGINNKNLKEFIVNLAKECNYNYPWLNDPLNIAVHHLNLSHSSNDNTVNNLCILPKQKHNELHGLIRRKANVNKKQEKADEFIQECIKTKDVILVKELFSQFIREVNEQNEIDEEEVD